MKVLFDTNVILDVMLDRPDFAEPASHLLSFVEQGEITGFVCATTVTTIHYLATKVMGKTESQKQIRNLLTLFEIASVNRTVIEEALRGAFSDFEDSVIHSAACHAGMESIVTRNLKDFVKSQLPVYNPFELLNIFRSSGSTV